MKKLLSLVLSLSVLATSAVFAQAATVSLDSSVGLGRTHVNAAATLVSGTALVATRPIQCDGAVSAYWVSDASDSSSMTIAVSPDNTTFVNVYGPVAASTTASRTVLTAGQQCYVRATLTPVAGSTATVSVDFLSEK